MNTPHVSRHPRGRGLAALLLLSLLCTAAAHKALAQEAGAEETNVSVLVSGPTPGRGIPFLPPNAIEYHRGLYELPDQNLLLYHTRREIVPPSSWEENGCGSTPLLTFQTRWKDLPAPVSSAESPVQPVTAFYRGEGYYLFFTFLGGSISCDFVESFIQKFIYFRSVSGGEVRRGEDKSSGAGEEKNSLSPPQFPAVLD